MKVVDAPAMRAMDQRAVHEFAMKGLQLMENAGRAVAEVVLKELGSQPVTPKRAAIICGKGNNGGDGFVVARHLKNAGVDVSVFSLGRLSDFKGDSHVNARCWHKMGGAVRYLKSSADLKKHTSAIEHAHVVVDAVLGTGLTSGVEGFYGEVIEYINTVYGKVVSIDVPSGMNASTGEAVGAAVRAEITVTMALPKVGFYLLPGSELAGRVEVVDIGMPRSILTDETARWNLITAEMVSAFLKPRPRVSHKYTYGHMAVLGGSPGKTGAPYMAALGAMRTGAGLATIGLPAGLNNIMECKTTEVMTFPLSEDENGRVGEGALEEIQRLLKGKTALVAGPGLGESVELRAVLNDLLKQCSLPMVFDADALNNFRGSSGDFAGASTDDLVLSPHPGEAARLLGLSTAEVQAHRIGTALDLAKRTGAVVVLKGANTIIAAPCGDVYINTTGGPALATAGTGDVLAGVIGGLLGQGLSALNAAITAVYIHGLAGDAVSRAHGGHKGLMATELLAELPRLINSLTHE